MIYVDHAATTQLDPDALHAMEPFLLEDFGNASQPYSFSRTARHALQDARVQIAECIGASPDEIYFTSGGTESDNWVIKGCPQKNANQSVICTSQIEHHAILNACRAVAQQHAQVTYLPVDRQGILYPETLASMITDDVDLVSVMLGNNEIGTIEPITELASVAHAHGALFHTDAVQAVGHIPVQVHDLDVDFLSASAHKFNGPKGIGFLYVRNGIQLHPLLHGGAQERNQRAGTENIPAIVGMAVALQNSIKTMTQTQEHLHAITDRLDQRLHKSRLDYICNGAQAHQLPGFVNLSIRHADGEMLLHRLDLKGIAISTGSACDANSTNLSHVIRAIETPDEYAKGTIRLTFGRENTLQDADTIADALLDILQV